jgi:kynurenine formamidase
MRFRWNGVSRITVEDVEKELQRIQYEIRPRDIVLVQTGADAVWGTEDYLVKGAGMDRDSTLFLTEKGVKVVRCLFRLKNSKRPEIRK